MSDQETLRKRLGKLRVSTVIPVKFSGSITDAKAFAYTPLLSEHQINAILPTVLAELAARDAEIKDLKQQICEMEVQRDNG